MTRIQIYAAAFLILLAAACSPKTGEKTTTTAVPSGKAPSIPVPTGDVRKDAPKAGDAPVIQIGKAESFKLDNGLQVIVVENHKLPRASYQLFVDYQPVLEKDAAGYVEMMGELLGKGTKSRSKAQIDEEIDFMGASISTNSNGINGSCLSKHSDKVLELMSDMLLNPTFPDTEFEKAKRRAESNLAQNKEDASAIAGNVGSRLRFGKSHPYGEFMTEETMNKITLDLIKKHYSTYFKPNVTYFVVVGDVTKSKVEQYAKKYFGKWQQGEVPKAQYMMPRPPEKTQVDFVNKNGAVQSVVNITYPVELTPGTPDVIPVKVMNTILGGSGYFNNRVNANLREKHGWTYGARTNINPDELVGAFTASASVRNAVTDSSIIEFLKEMTLIRTEKVKNNELSVVKNVLTGQFSQSLEEPGTVANFALNTARFNLPADYYQNYLTNLQKVSPEDVLVMAKKYVRPDRAHILVVGNKDEVPERLKQFASDGKVNMLDAYANPVKVVNTNIPPGMTAEKVVEDYITAIGGRAAIAAIKDQQTTIKMKARGAEITIKESKKEGSKLCQEMLMGNQPMGKTILVDGKASQSGMGGAVREVEGAELAELKEQALPIKESAYKNAGYTMTLKGLEDIDGKAAYIIEVVHPGGAKTTEYYDVTSSLKVRELSTQNAPDGQPATISNDYSEYKEINGVKFPHAVTSTGLFPVPMKMNVVELKVNSGLSDDLFK